MKLICTALDGAQVYSPDAVEHFVPLCLGKAERDQLDPILDASVATCLSDLDEDGQVAFKGNASRSERFRHYRT